MHIFKNGGEEVLERMKHDLGDGLYAYKAASADEAIEAAILDSDQDCYAYEIWPCAEVLCRHLPKLLSELSLNQPVSIHDVGAATGAVSLTFANLGYDCYAYDHDKVAESWLIDAASEQKLVVHTGQDLHANVQAAGRYGFIILSDMFYDADVSAFAKEITQFAMNVGGYVCFADPYREHAEPYIKWLTAQANLDCKMYAYTHLYDTHAVRVRLGVVNEQN